MLAREGHPHASDCDQFKLALQLGHIVVIDGDAHIPNKLPPGSELIGKNVREILDHENYYLGMVLFVCPWCGATLVPDGDK